MTHRIHSFFATPKPRRIRATWSWWWLTFDSANEQTAWLDLKLDALGVPWQGSFVVEDLLTGTTYTWNNQWNYVALRPSQMPAHVFRVVRP